MKNWAETQSTHSDAKFSSILNKLELNELVKTFLEPVPNVVKTILGQTHVIATDLLYIGIQCV
jgi:hypothetical protein